MEKERNQHGFFSRKLRAGRKRTYFFDVRSTKQGDYFITITESKKRFDGDGYDSHKIFLYKEDFQEFTGCLNEALDYLKKELNPDFDYDNYNREIYRQQMAKEIERREKSSRNTDDLYTDSNVVEPEISNTEINKTTPADNEALEW